MAKATTRKKGKKDQVSDPGPKPRWRVLPPEIIRMILQYLVDDKATLRVCSQIAHDFRYVAQSFLGRHLTVNTADRLGECVPLIANGAFQHVRSLDIGVNNKSVILEAYWDAYLVILQAFAQYRALNRLWLSQIPFHFVGRSQKKNLRETIVAFGSTVTELGLYGCHFSSYEEMISLIRSLPLCSFLFIRDCVTGEQATGGNALAGLPKYKLNIKDLQLSSSSSNELLIDVSNLIEDAALDVGSLTSLVCDVGTSEKTQRVAAAVSMSPVDQFQVACTESGGFQAFMDYFAKKWALKSLTIGPQSNETNLAFWEEALNGLPPLPRVDNVTIIYNYPRIKAFNTDCWHYFDRILARRDLFPGLKGVYINASCGSQQLIPRRWWTIFGSLRAVRARGIGPHRYLGCN